MGNFSKFPTCPPFSMLLSDYSQINLGDGTIKFSPCRLRSSVRECTLIFTNSLRWKSLSINSILYHSECVNFHTSWYKISYDTRAKTRFLDKCDYITRLRLVLQTHTRQKTFHRTRSVMYYFQRFLRMEPNVLNSKWSESSIREEQTYYKINVQWCSKILVSTVPFAGWVDKDTGFEPVWPSVWAAARSSLSFALVVLR